MKDEIMILNCWDSLDKIKLSKEELEKFLKDKNINLSNTNSNQIFDNFLLFQQFLKYMITSSNNKSHTKTYRNNNIKKNKLSSTLKLNYNDKHIIHSPIKSNLIEITKRNISELNSTKTTDKEYNKKTYNKLYQHKMTNTLKLHNNLKKTHFSKNPSKQLIYSSSTKQQVLSKSNSNQNEKEISNLQNTNTYNRNNYLKGNHSFSVRNTNISSTNQYHSNNKAKDNAFRKNKQCKISLINKKEFSHNKRKNDKKGNNMFIEGLMTWSSSSIIDDHSFSKCNKSNNLFNERNNSYECVHKVNGIGSNKDTIKIIDQQHLDDKEKYKEIFESELQLLQKEKEEVAKLKNEYFILKQQLHKDIKEFNNIKHNEYTKMKHNKENNVNKYLYKSPKQTSPHINNSPQIETNINEPIKQTDHSSKPNFQHFKHKLHPTNIQINNFIPNNNNNIYSSYISNNNTKNIPPQYASSLSINDKIHHLLSNFSSSSNNIAHLNKLNNKPISSDNTKRNIHSNNETPSKSTSQLQTNIISNIINRTHLLKHNVNNNQHHFHYNTTSNNCYSTEEYNSNHFKIPSKYILPPNIKIKSEKTENNKNIKEYTNGVKEIVFQSGVIKRIFPDNYSIIYYKNNDIKQIFPDGHSVYFSSEAKNVQKSVMNNLNINKVMKCEKGINLQKDIKEETDSNETERTVKQNEFPTVQISCTEIGDGVKEIKYSSGSKVYEFE